MNIHRPWRPSGDLPAAIHEPQTRPVRGSATPAANRCSYTDGLAQPCSMMRGSSRMSVKPMVLGLSRMCAAVTLPANPENAPRGLGCLVGSESVATACTTCSRSSARRPGRRRDCPTAGRSWSSSRRGAGLPRAAGCLSLDLAANALLERGAQHGRVGCRAGDVDSGERLLVGFHSDYTRPALRSDIAAPSASFSASRSSNASTSGRPRINTGARPPAGIAASAR